MTTENNVSGYTPMQIDAFREFGNIGASHASSALTILLRRDILIEVTECLACQTTRLPYAFGNVEQRMVAVYFDAIGKEKGSMLMMMTEELTMQMSDILLGREHVEGRQLNDDDKEAAAEIGNICASAYLSAISQLLGIQMLPSPPGIAVDMLGAILQYPAALVAERSDKVIMVKTDFIIEGKVWPGFILYIPDSESEKILMKKFGAE